VTTATPGTTVSFGRFEFDMKASQLTRGGVRVRLSQQPMQVLSLLLERPGEVVSREYLRQKLWPADVFVDFDHGMNKSVQKLRDALGDSAEGSRYIETIPRTGYRFVAPVHSPAVMPVPVSHVVAEPPAMASVAGEPGREVLVLRWGKVRWPPWLVAAGCLVVLAGVAGWWIRKEKLAEAPIHSVAVIPLENLTGDAGKEYIADGMTDELTTMLAKNSTLKVTSRTSMMQYKGVHRALPEIAREVGVDGILEGSISGTGDRIHLTIQLIQAPSDTHVWAESYDRDTKDLVSLPRDAAQAIATRLGSAVTSPVVPRYVSPEAHDAYLHGWYLWMAGQNDKAGEYFKQATEIQPDYALGWAGLSIYYGQGLIGGDMDPAKALEPKMATARKAVAMDDSLAQAHLAMASSYFINDWNWAETDRELSRAIELDPKFAEAYHFRAKVYGVLGRKQEAIEVQKMASDLAPFDRPFALALTYLEARQYDAAIKEAGLRLESNPADAFLHWMLHLSYLRKGMLKEAVEELEEAYIVDGQKEFAERYRLAYAHGGYHAVILSEMDVLKKTAAKGYVSPMKFAALNAQLGRRQETLALLEEAYRQHAPELLWIQTDPAYDFLHSDERYRSIVKGTGLPPMN
jgi:TolB-like protein/DNA-binding winged helix-turn-helix (wHTH) protein/Tfp pilus assembly protein PilF